ncbi:MAG: TlyA family RNA methyltransferase [Lachnospiraceae bacterium]|nr:TlyA family RNA methyltransferase [Lachnospiraceae bacterium]
MKERLDVLLVKNGYAPSREKAKAIIMAGLVYVDGQKEDKAGQTFEEEGLKLEVRGNTLKYVSRGGLKLERALEVFPINLNDATCIDIGASTGGFTDCMLQNGAAKVYSIDVGHGQLDWKLRNDERVICMEKTNFRYMTKTDIDDEVDFASCDVSFISLSKILGPAFDILKNDGQMVSLIKPQFEAGRDQVGKKGVVKDPKVHVEVIKKCVGYAMDAGFKLLDLSNSPIKGPEGNIEYLMYLLKDQDSCVKSEDCDDCDIKNSTVAYEKYIDTELSKKIEDLVEKTHEEFLRNSQ